jgi:hypothetical protein
MYEEEKVRSISSATVIRSQFLAIDFKYRMEGEKTNSSMPKYVLMILIFYTFKTYIYTFIHFVKKLNASLLFVKKINNFL